MNTYDKILSYKYDFYRELYEDGITQREQVSNKYTSTITLIVAEITGLIWLVLKLLKEVEDKCKINKTECRAIILLAITFGFIFISVVFFILCFTGFSWSYPKPKEIKEYIDKKETKISKCSEKALLDNIIENSSEIYIQIAIANIEEINKHTKHLNVCYVCIIIALVFLLTDFIYMLMFSMF